MDLRLRESISNQNEFALHLSKHVGSTVAAGGNFVLSPASLHAILALIAAGSKGPTLDQILSILRSKSSGDLNALSSQIVDVVLADGSASGGPKISVVNGVWVDSSVSLKRGFKEIVASSFKAEARAVDFKTKAAAVVNDVNSWVENKTAGLIKELLPARSVDNNTKLVLGNALYFKGAWEIKFYSSETEDSDFFLLDGSSVQAQFMTTKKKQYVFSYDDFSVLRLPYKRGNDMRQFSMCIFLPNAKDGLWNLLDKMSADPRFLDRHFPRQKAIVGKFKLPKFKISYGFEASAALKSLGLGLPFTMEGDLTEMVDLPLYVSAIFHKSFIEVNEQGTEAAGASAAVMKEGCSRSLPLGPFDFEADHPFAFVIREDRTGVVLFTGHVLNPSLSG
ncbi:serpin-ZXA-like [Asparagus officinalis]|uniref:serpin-ZXA-like n=1 Tax=Asparagus officinalis TaxID=4686 RepID=UPI00098E146F|nr:serpin-ZXA-like [Asparagus officinalis]